MRLRSESVNYRTKIIVTREIENAYGKKKKIEKKNKKNRYVRMSAVSYTKNNTPTHKLISIN